MIQRSFDEIAIALAEDYSLEELTNLPVMERTLQDLLGVSVRQARILAVAAVDIKLLWNGSPPKPNTIFRVH